MYWARVAPRALKYLARRPLELVREGGRTIVRKRKRHHAADVMFIPRRHHGHVGKQPQISKIEHAVVRGSIGTGETGPIEQERHGQVLQRHLLKDLIVAAL